MLLNVISFNLCNDPKSCNAHFPLHILSVPFSILLTAPRRLSFYGLCHRLPCPLVFFLGLANGRPQQDRGG